MAFMVGSLCVSVERGIVGKIGETNRGLVLGFFLGLGKVIKNIPEYVRYGYHQKQGEGRRRKCFYPQNTFTSNIQNIKTGKQNSPD